MLRIPDRACVEMHALPHSLLSRTPYHHVTSIRWWMSGKFCGSENPHQLARTDPHLVGHQRYSTFLFAQVRSSIFLYAHFPSRGAPFTFIHRSLWFLSRLRCPSPILKHSVSSSVIAESANLPRLPNSAPTLQDRVERRTGPVIHHRTAADIVLPIATFLILTLVPSIQAGRLFGYTFRHTLP